MDSVAVQGNYIISAPRNQAYGLLSLQVLLTPSNKL